MAQSVATKESTRLGELLVSLGLVDQFQVNRCLQIAQHSEVPLGHPLVSLGLLREEELQRALRLQASVRASEMEAKTAIEAYSFMKRLRVYLEVAQTRWTFAEQAAGNGRNASDPASGQETNRASGLAISGQASVSACKNIKLGELLVMSGLVTEGAVVDSLAVSLIKSKKIGQVLVEMGAISLSLLDAALDLQSAVNSRAVPVTVAIGVLSYMSLAC